MNASQLREETYLPEETPAQPLAKVYDFLQAHETATGSDPRHGTSSPVPSLVTGSSCRRTSTGCFARSSMRSTKASPSPLRRIATR